MTQTESRDAVEQRGALVEEILAILSPQLDREPLVTADQLVELYAAIAHFAEGQFSADKSSN